MLFKHTKDQGQKYRAKVSFILFHIAKEVDRQRVIVGAKNTNIYLRLQTVKYNGWKKRDKFQRWDLCHT